MEPRILIVEDIPEQLDSLELNLNEIPSNVEQSYRIDKFHIDKTRWADEAVKLLLAAAAAQKPYAIVLLDLSLPRHETDRSEDVQHGLDIIKLAREKEAAHEILVISAHGESHNMLPAFLTGAVDFIHKPYTFAELQERVLKSWDRVLAKKSAVILDRRIRALVPYAEMGLAHRFSACFSRLVQSVVHETEGL